MSPSAHFRLPLMPNNNNNNWLGQLPPEWALSQSSSQWSAEVVRGANDKSGDLSAASQLSTLGDKHKSYLAGIVSSVANFLGFSS